MKKRTAVITGVTGQDGAYLAKMLLEKNYLVYGTIRRTSADNYWRLDELEIMQHQNFHLVNFDLHDFGAALQLIRDTEPDEFYNLAAQSFVGLSFEQPALTSLVTGHAVLGILEAIKMVNPAIRFYQASTSEMFGLVQEIPQKETTPFYPRSPYGCAKVFAHHLTVNYRESYNMFASCGILFNHESPLRGLEFVTRKVTHGLCQIYLNGGGVLRLGNLDAKRDWGHARDYVAGMWKMLQANESDSFILASGKTVSVRSFVEITCQVLGIDLEWVGTGRDEIGINRSSGKTVITVDSDFYRPAEVDLLMGDPSKAREKLDWSATTPLDALINEMVEADLRRLNRAG
jgi:GDPmannose 4,6-dehydratase